MSEENDTLCGICGQKFNRWGVLYEGRKFHGISVCETMGGFALYCTSTRLALRYT